MNKKKFDPEVEIVKELEACVPGTPEYKELLEQLKLAKQTKFYIWRFDSDTLLTTIAHLSSIVLVMNFERLHILTSRALGFIPKLKK